MPPCLRCIQSIAATNRIHSQFALRNSIFATSFESSRRQGQLSSNAAGHGISARHGFRLRTDTDARVATIFARTEPHSELNYHLS